MKHIIILAILAAFFLTGAVSCANSPGKEEPASNTGDSSWHEVGSAGEPAFQNGWVNYNASTYSTCAFRKDGNGYVHLKGTIMSGNSNTTVFTIPAGYRPLKMLMLVIYGGAVNTVIAANPSGQIYLGPNFNSFACMDGASYYAEQ